MALRDDILNEYPEGVELDDELPAELQMEVVEGEDEEDEQTRIGMMLDEAIQWREENLDDLQRDATDYYHARKFGNEEEGRSQVVSTDVRDTVQAIMPSIIRVFLGGSDAVEFRPEGPEDVEAAAQKTDYVNRIVMREDNPGFLILHGAFKDAMIRKMGIFKWWWDESVKREGGEYTGIDEEMLMVLASDPEVVETEVIGETESDDGTVLYDVRIKREQRSGRARFACVPNEELVWSPGARSIAEAQVVAHVRDVPAHELIEMGIDPDLVDENKGYTSDTSRTDMLAAARRVDEGATSWHEDEVFEELRPVRFAEAYVKRVGEDGVLELRKYNCVGGTAWKIDSWEVVDEVPFGIICPDPEPHTMVGLSVADYTMDIQLIKSAIQRGQLDSLNLALNPQRIYQEGAVSVADLLNPEIGNLIRADRTDAVREVAHDFIGREALPVLAYYDEVKENRTGISKAAAGLDADALQSSTKAAVAATITGAQQHIEVMARIFAETGVKDLFKGLLGLILKHQDKARTVKLRGRWVPIDPRRWNKCNDVQVNVAIGAGLDEEKMQKLALHAAKQEQLLAMGSPIVTMVEYRRTLAKMAELSGIANPDELYKPWGPNEEAQAQQAKAQQPPPPDPTQMLMQVEMMKVQQAQQEAAFKLQLEQQKMMLEDDRERDKIAQDYALKRAEIEAKSAAAIEKNRMDAEVNRRRAEMDADIKARAAQSQGNQ